MMRRNGNVINLAAVLIVLPYTALYFLMRLNILIIQGGGGRRREKAAETTRRLMMRDAWNAATSVYSPPPHFLLSFSLCRGCKRLSWRQRRRVNFTAPVATQRGKKRGDYSYLCRFIRFARRCGDDVLRACDVSFRFRTQRLSGEWLLLFSKMQI